MKEILFVLPILLILPIRFIMFILLNSLIGCTAGIVMDSAITIPVLRTTKSYGKFSRPVKSLAGQ